MEPINDLMLGISAVAAREFVWKKTSGGAVKQYSRTV